MKLFSKIFLTAIISGIIFAGCYTQLMNPNEFVQAQRQYSQKSIVDNSFSLNYNQSCVTCHSPAELDERAEELELLGIRTVHNGVLLSSRPWENVTTATPEILYPAPNPYWPIPYHPTSPWWNPPVTIETGTSPSSPNGNRTRDGGTTRDGNRERERSTPTTYSAPPTPVGGTTPSAPVSTPPASTVSTPPPAQTSDSERSRDNNSGNNSSTRTRSDGNSRDDSGNRPR